MVGAVEFAPRPLIQPVEPACALADALGILERLVRQGLYLLPRHGFPFHFSQAL